MSVRFNRRGFLLGAGGTMLAIPLLESLAPRIAHGQMTAPKRLLIVMHQQGRLIGNGSPDDWWSPRATTGPLPPAGTAPSQMLAQLAPIRDEIVTVDGVDNFARHLSSMADGHIPAQVAVLTCTPQDPGGEWRSTGPSLDYVAGMRLRSGPGMRPSLIMPATCVPYFDAIQQNHFFGPGGTDATMLTGSPHDDVAALFGPPTPAMMPPPTAPPTLRDRMTRRRASLLDGVTASLHALRGRVSAADRARLDSHADFISTVEARFAAGGTTMAMATQSCARPDETVIPQVHPANYDEFEALGGDTAPEWMRGRNDATMWPFIMENTVQALACDVVRSMALVLHRDPAWTTEFTGTSPFDGGGGDGPLHDWVHGLPEVANDMGHASDINTGFQAWGRQFTQLVQRLAAIQDVDGNRLLDNTLVLWVSEMGHGSEHTAWNIPVVMAGMRSAFPQGQGRHVVGHHTMGDLCSQALRMLGGTDTTFGVDGTLGAAAAAAGVSLDLGPARSGVDANTPMHLGPLDL